MTLMKLDIDTADETAEEKSRREGREKFAEHLTTSQVLMRAVMDVLVAHNASVDEAASALTAAQKLYESVPYSIRRAMSGEKY